MRCLIFQTAQSNEVSRDEPDVSHDPFKDIIEHITSYVNKGKPDEVSFDCGQDETVAAASDAQQTIQRDDEGETYMSQLKETVEEINKLVSGKDVDYYAWLGLEGGGEDKE